MKHDRFFVLALFVSALGSCSPRGEMVYALAPTNLRLEVSVDKPIIKVGEEPRFTARLINDGPIPITVVRPGDGSWSGRRTPILRWNPPMARRPGCGNINALRADEVVTLAVGESIPISCFHRWENVGPGVHRLTMEMENIPDKDRAGVLLSPHDATALERVRRTAPFKAVSNVVEIEVRP